MFLFVYLYSEGRDRKDMEYVSREAGRIWVELREGKNQIGMYCIIFLICMAFPPTFRSVHHVCPSKARGEHQIP